MRYLRTSPQLLGLVAFVAAGPTPASAQTWMEFTVVGTASVSEREEDTMICSKTTDDALLGRGGADWVIEFEAPSAEPGTHDARFRVAAPRSVAALHDTNFRTDDRLSGTGTITIEEAGTGQMNLKLLRIRFSATELASDTGAQIGLTGTMLRPLM